MAKVIASLEWRQFNPGSAIMNKPLLRAGQTLLAGILLAQATTALAEGSEFFADLPVVLSVSRLSQPLREAPGAVTVIDREMIRSSGARLVSDLMRLVPGFQVTTPNQEAPRVTYHGLGEEFPSRLQVLVDGVSQYSPLYQSGVNWNLIPVALEDIERIEVLRGSNSVAYGANAFLGVVNIITQQAAQTPGASLSVNHGSGGINDYFVRWGGKAPGADFRFSLREQRDEGLDKFHDAARTIPTYNDTRRNRVISLRADLYPSARDVVTLGFTEVTNNNGQNTVYHDFLQRNRTLQVGWQRTLSPEQDFRINYALTREFGDDTHEERSGPYLLSLNYGGLAERHDFDAQHNFSPAAGVRVAWGVGFRAEAVNQPLFYYGDVRQTRNSKRLFASAEWSLSPRWLLNAGGSIEHDTLGGTMAAPRLSLHHHFNEENTLRLGASRAFRAPSLFEQRADWRWTPTNAQPFFKYYYLAGDALKPERVDSTELGYIGEFRRLALSLDVRAFHEKIDQRMLKVARKLDAAYCANPYAVLCAEDAVDYTVNGQNVRVQGIEYQLRWQPLPDTRLLLNQAFVRTRSELLTFVTDQNAENLAKYTTQTDASAPERSTTLMLIQRLPHDIEFSLAQHHVASVRWTLNQTPVAPYVRTDWRLAKRFRVGPQNVEVAYTGRSTTGEYGDFRNHYVVTPRHFVSLSMGL